MANRYQQIQKARAYRVRGVSIFLAKKLCPRGDLATYDTGGDLSTETGLTSTLAVWGSRVRVPYRREDMSNQ
jgi:hypothetical protein